MLEITCPHCERRLQMPESAAFAECKCPVCCAEFLPAELRREKLYAVTGTEEASPEIDQVKIDRAKDDHEKEILAERARFLRELNDADPVTARREERWTKCKTAAQIGFGIGGASGALSIILHGELETCSHLGPAVGIGALGAVNGILIVALPYSAETQDRAWMQKLLVTMLTLWMLGVFIFSRQTGPLLGMVNLLIATGTGTLTVFFSYMFFSAFIGMVRKFTK